MKVKNINGTSDNTCTCEMKWGQMGSGQMGSGSLYDCNTSFLTLSKMIVWVYWSYNDPDPPSPLPTRIQAVPVHPFEEKCRSGVRTQILLIYDSQMKV